MKVARVPPAATVEEYLAEVPPRFRRLLQHLRRTVRAIVPDAQEVISYRMPAFRYHGMLVYYAAFQDHCSFFVGGPKTRLRLASELRPFESGKGTLRFTPEHPLPDALVTKIVRARVAENLVRRPQEPGARPRGPLTTGGNGPAARGAQRRGDASGRPPRGRSRTR